MPVQHKDFAPHPFLLLTNIYEPYAITTRKWPKSSQLIHIEFPIAAEKGVVVLPEFSLLSGASRGLRSLARPAVHSERKVLENPSNLSRICFLNGLDGVVGIAADRTFIIGEFIHRHGSIGSSPGGIAVIAHLHQRQFRLLKGNGQLVLACEGAAELSHLLKVFLMYRRCSDPGFELIDRASPVLPVASILVEMALYLFVAQFQIVGLNHLVHQLLNCNPPAAGFILQQNLGNQLVETVLLFPVDLLLELTELQGNGEDQLVLRDCMSLDPSNDSRAILGCGCNRLIFDRNHKGGEKAHHTAYRKGLPEKTLFKGGNQDEQNDGKIDQTKDAADLHGKHDPHESDFNSETGRHPGRYEPSSEEEQGDQHGVICHPPYPNRNFQKGEPGRLRTPAEQPSAKGCEPAYVLRQSCRQGDDHSKDAEDE